MADDDSLTRVIIPPLVRRAMPKTTVLFQERLPGGDEFVEELKKLIEELTARRH
jgi:hypothetical protein